MTYIKNFFSFTLFLLPILNVACTGSLLDRAQNMLYPLDYVNETKVPEVPPDGYLELKLKALQDPSDENSNFNDIHAWYRKHADSQRPVIIYLHGNGVNLGSLWEANILKAFDRLETHWVVFDFPGYGRSTGVPSMPSINAAADAVMNWTRTTFPNSKIIIWGRSMGAAVAAQLAERHQSSIEKLILTSPWANTYSLAKDKVGSLVDDVPKEWMEDNSWKTTEIVPLIHSPTLIIHGTKDKVIPIKFGKEVFSKFPNSVAEFIEFPEREHNDLFADPEYWNAISEFIQ